MPLNERRIFQGAGLCVALVVAAVILPRFLPQGDGGFAAAANAVVIFLGLIAISAIAGIALLALTIRRFDHLGTAARIAGALPACVTVGGLIWLLLWLGF